MARFEIMKISVLCLAALLPGGLALAQTPPPAPAAGTPVAGTPPVAAAAPAPTTPAGPGSFSPPPQLAATPPSAASAAPTGSDSGGSLPDFLGVQNKLRTAEGAPTSDESLLFTPWQHALLEEAKRGFSTRPAGSAGSDANKAPAIRELSLGGILYRTPKDWTIYLNNQRVTPDKVPEEIVDIRVEDDDVRLKWFDSQTNLIFPIVLHANQRFNLDARIFLPGVGGVQPVSTQ